MRTSLEKDPPQCIFADHQSNSMDSFRISLMPYSTGLMWMRSVGDRENAGRPLADPDTFDQTKEAPRIFCRNCRFAVTSPSERIEVNSFHRHTFANPNGYLFEIGCFKEAEGCAATGMRTDEFTWFKGYFWQVGICRKCHNHLGWLFQSSGDYFYGLILNRLSE